MKESSKTLKNPSPQQLGKLLMSSKTRRGKKQLFAQRAMNNYLELQRPSLEAGKQAQKHSIITPVRRKQPPNLSGKGWTCPKHSLSEFARVWEVAPHTGSFTGDSKGSDDVDSRHRFASFLMNGLRCATALLSLLYLASLIPSVLK